MFGFGRKKKKLKAKANAEAAPVAINGARKIPTEEEYKSYIKSAKERIELSLDEYGNLAEALRTSAKRVSRVKGIFASKISRRKQRKHGNQLKIYNDALSAFISASSELNWLIESVNSSYEGLARASSSAREAKRIRVEAEKYSAGVMLKKAKHDRRVDGVVMPISSYIK